MNRENALSRWHRSPAAIIRSDNPLDAANRIYDGFADVQAERPGRLLKRDSKVFTMPRRYVRRIT